MKTAIDSSALLAIFNDEPDGRAWLDVLVQARREGHLVVCDVVYAEVAPAFPSEGELREALRKLGASFQSVSPSAAWQAGVAFRAYRDAGGPREHLLPDFLIAAHALCQADRLAAVDRGYLRRYFSGLSLLQP
ncbi:MAG: type II toxin-antitoxin system VapC family toxin [Candidatus Latescibacterota bacterium]